MIYIYIGIGIVFIAALILILLKNEKDEIDSILIKIDESEDNIDILLEKKLKILCDVSKTINEKEEDKILTNIGKIKNKTLDSFGLYKELNKNSTINISNLQGGGKNLYVGKKQKANS